MFKQVIVLFSILFFLITSCEVEPKTQVNSSKENETKYKTVKADEICSIEVPSYFWKMPDLNSEALIQYGFNDTLVDSTALIQQDVIYVTTSVFYKMDLQNMIGDSTKLDLLDFNANFVDNMERALDEARPEFIKPNINEQNGVKSLHNEIYGSFGDDLVYYQIGLFETEIGYYQVLSWCLQDHLAKHKDEMFKMTTSFKEI